MQKNLEHPLDIFLSCLWKYEKQRTCKLSAVVFLTIKLQMTGAYTIHDTQLYTIHISEVTGNRHYFKKGKPQCLV